MQYIVGLFEEIAALFLSILMMFGGVTTPATGDLLRNFSDDVNIDFVLTGDTQVCDYMPEREANLMSFSEDMMNAEIELDAFLIVGDIAENGLLEEYQLVYNEFYDLSDRFIMATGNHDIRLRLYSQSVDRFSNFTNSLNKDESMTENVWKKIRDEL